MLGKNTMNKDQSTLKLIQSQEFKYQELKNTEKIAFIEFNPELQNTIIFIHGNMITSLWWYPLFENFMKQNKYRVIFLDLRGFGRSTYNNKINTLDDFVNDIVEFCQLQNIKQSHFVGWSLGGMITQLLASKHHDLVQQIILVASGSPTGFPIFKIDPETKMYTMERCSKVEEMVQDQKIMGTLKIYASKDKEQLKQLFNMVLFNGKGYCPSDPQLYDLMLEETLTQRNYVEVCWALNIFNISDAGGTGEIKNIKSKILIYHGDKDLVIPLIQGKGLAVDIGEEKCTVMIKQGAAHCPPMDYADDLFQQIMDFTSQ